MGTVHRGAAQPAHRAHPAAQRAGPPNVLALDDAQLVVGDAWSELERLAAWRGAASTPALDVVLLDHDILAPGPFRLKVHVPEWISQGNPLPDDALVDTAIMPPRKPEAPAGIRRVK